jgi:hypothetical protein
VNETATPSAAESPTATDGNAPLPPAPPQVFKKEWKQFKRDYPVPQQVWKARSNKEKTKLRRKKEAEVMTMKTPDGFEYSAPLGKSKLSRLVAFFERSNAGMPFESASALLTPVERAFVFGYVEAKARFRARQRMEEARKKVEAWKREEEAKKAADQTVEVKP